MRCRYLKIHIIYLIVLLTLLLVHHLLLTVDTENGVLVLLNSHLIRHQILHILLHSLISIVLLLLLAALGHLLKLALVDRETACSRRSLSH